MDSNAEFIYVPKEKVFEKARGLDAIAHDLPGAEYTHEGEFCTFDYIIRKHNIIDGAVNQIAAIVRGLTQIVLTSPAGGRALGNISRTFL